MASVTLSNILSAKVSSPPSPSLSSLHTIRINYDKLKACIDKILGNVTFNTLAISLTIR